MEPITRGRPSSQREVTGWAAGHSALLWTPLWGPSLDNPGEA